MAFFSFLLGLIIVQYIAVKWVIFYVLPVSSVKQGKANRHIVFKGDSSKVRGLRKDSCTDTLREGYKNARFCNHAGRSTVMTDAIGNLCCLLNIVGIVWGINQHVIPCEIRGTDR